MDRRHFLAKGTAVAALFGSERVFRSPVLIAATTGAPVAAKGSIEGSPEAFAEPAYIKAGSSTWLVGNGLVERRLKYSPENGLHTESWTHKATSTNFLQHLPNERPWRPTTPWGAEFSFQVDSEKFDGAVKGPSADFELVSSQTYEITPAGKTPKDQAQSQKRRLEISAHYAILW